MKKLLTLTIAILFVLSSTFAIAGGWSFPKPNNSEVEVFAAGDSNDYSFDDSGFSIWIFNFPGDDWAEAGAGSTANVTGNFKAGALFGARSTHADGSVHAWGCSDSYAHAIDLTLIPYSKAWSGSETNVYLRGRGNAGASGGFLPYAKAELEGTVEGSAYQATYAEEGDFSGTSANGGENATATFYGTTYDKDFDLGLFCGADANAHVNMRGHAVVDGSTEVYTDPYGKNQSAYAMTENRSHAGVHGEDYAKNEVEGSGGVGVFATSGDNGGNAYAGGNASFNYYGASGNNINGAGMAQMNANVNVGGSGCQDGSCFEASSSGSAFSQVSDGNRRGGSPQ